MILLIVLLVALALVMINFRAFDRPWATFGWSVLGGLVLALILFGVLYFLARYSLFPFDPLPQRHAGGEDWGGLAVAVFRLAVFVIIPVAGFLLGFALVLASIAVQRTLKRRSMVDFPGGSKRIPFDPERH